MTVITRYHHCEIWPWTIIHLSSFAVDLEDDGDGDKVESSKDELCPENVGTMLCGIVQTQKDVHKPRRIPEESVKHTWAYFCTQGVYIAMTDRSVVKRLNVKNALRNLKTNHQLKYIEYKEYSAAGSKNLLSTIYIIHM